ncbi:FadD3 family acyl-CoA ligase [Halieaceae bacterium]|nr:FadD3 family acyl-CoA ligase [Halieaceae bacterium]
MDRPKPTTITELIEQAGACFGENHALIESRQDSDTPFVLSYHQLFSASWQACRAFMAAGVAKGDRVAIWAPNINEWVIATLGLQLAGGVLVPINTRLKGAEAAYILNASKAKYLLTVADFLNIDYLELLAEQNLPDLNAIFFLRGNSKGGTSWAEFLKLSTNITEAEARQRAASIIDEDPVDILFTSGTTGKSKGVISSHGQNLRVYMAWGERIGIVPGDRYLVINPFYHTFGYKAGWLTCLLFGAAILPAITFDVVAVMKTIESLKVTVMPGPPTIFQSLLSNTRREDYDLSSLRMITTGATTVPVTLVERIRNELGVPDVRTAYGLTESCGVVSVSLKEDSSEKVANTSGYPIPGIQVQCVDLQGNSLPAGQAGEIWVRGYNVMDSYLDNPVATAQAVDKQGWLHTGDIGILDEEGYLQITDRLKDMFIVGGFNCYPAEVEQQLSALAGVEQVAVVGTFDERLGEVGHAFIVRQQGSALDEDVVISWCKQSMANYKVPRYVSFMTDLPKNSLGKVMKNALRDVSKSN